MPGLEIRLILSCGYKKNLGIHVVEPDIQLLKKQKKLGFDFIIYSLDTKLLSKSLDEFDLQI